MNKNTLLLVAIALLFIFNQGLVAQSNHVQSIEIEYDIEESLYSNLLNESREFWVKLPENYDPSSDERYPVVFLLDGFSLKNSLEAIYTNYWGHYLPHMILVGVSNQSNRTRDLTTSSIKMIDRQSTDTQTGGAELFTQFIEEELIPYLDGTYPTTPYRTLIGHSYAGLFTINTLLNHSDLFENYIAIDPSLEWDNQKLLRQAKEKLKSENYKGKSLYVSLAAEQLHMFDEKVTLENVMADTSEFTLFARSIIDFSTFIESQTESGLYFSWNAYPEDLHGTVPLPSIRDGLTFLFEWYQFKTPAKYNNPATSAEEIAELLRGQEEIYSAHFGYKVPPMIEEMLNEYGYMNMQMGLSERAYLFFKMSIDHYPRSANAYSSMADYYQVQNDNSNALKYLSMAYEIAPSDQLKQRIEYFKKYK